MADRTAPRFMLLLARAARAAQQTADAGLADLGLTSAQGGVLFAVPKEGGVGVSAIAEQLGLAQSVVSVLTQRLVEQGLLVRAPDPDDRRAVRLSLTPEGAAARAEAARRARMLNARITREFSSAEQAAIARFLEGVIGLKEVGDE